MSAQGIGDLARAVGPRAMRLIVVLAIVALCASLGLQLNAFMQSRATDQAGPPPSNVEVTRRAPPPRVTGREIAAWNLFGVAKVEGEAAATDMESLPETNLKFILRGTFAAEAEKNSSAIIEGPDDRVEFYAVGDGMPAGASLHAVYRDRVVLSRGGRLETLFFPRVEGLPGAGGGAARSPAARVEQRKREIMQQQLEQIREKLRLRQQQQQQQQEQG